MAVNCCVNRRTGRVVVFGLLCFTVELFQKASAHLKLIACIANSNFWKFGYYVKNLVVSGILESRREKLNEKQRNTNVVFIYDCFYSQ